MSFDPSSAVLVEENKPTFDPTSAVLVEEPSPVKEEKPLGMTAAEMLLPPVEEGSAAPVESEKETAGLGRSAVHGILQGTLGAAAKLATGVQGGMYGAAGDLADVVGLGSLRDKLKGMGDAVFEKGKITSDTLSEIVGMTDERRKNQTIPEKVLEGVSGFAPLLALGPNAPLLGAINAFNSSASGAIEAGESVEAARKIGTFQAAGTLAFLRLPAYGRNWRETTGLVLGTGPVAGAGVDYLSSLSAETAEGKNPYVYQLPDGSVNKEYIANRFVEILTGGAFGVYGQRKWQNQPQQILVDTLNRMSEAQQQKFWADRTDVVNESMKINEWKTYRRTNETWEQARDRFFADKGNFAKWFDTADPSDTQRYANVPQALEIMYRTTPDPFQKAYIAYLLERSNVEGLNWANVFAVDRAGPAASLLDGSSGSYTGPHYDNTKDRVMLDTQLYKDVDLLDPQNPSMGGIIRPDVNWKGVFDTTLHEIGHVRTSFLKRRIAEGTEPKDFSIFESKVFPKIKDIIEQRWKTTDLDTISGSRFRGLDNIWEFFAEMPLPTRDPRWTIGKPTDIEPNLIDRDFKEDLRKIELTPSELKDLLPPRTPKLLSANSERFFQMLGINTRGEPKTLLDVSALWYEYMTRDVNFADRAQANKQLTSFDKDNQGQNPKTVGMKPSLDEAIWRKADWEDKFRNLDSATKTFWKELWYHMRLASDVDEFKARLINIDPANKQLAEWVLKNGDSVFERRDWYGDAIAKQAGLTTSASEALSKLALMDGTADDLIRNFYNELVQGDDIKLNAFGRMFLNPLAIRMMLRNNNFADMAVKFMIDKGMKYSHEADKIFHQLKTEDAVEYYRLSKADQAKVMNVVAHYDSTMGRGELIRQGMQWPDEAMLRNQGLDDNGVAAYQGLARAIDNSFNILNVLSKKVNGTELPRIPGFMPHYHDGPYKVFLAKQIGTDSNGRPVMRTVIVRGFKTRHYAKKFMQTMVNKGFEVVADPKTKKPIREYKYDEVGTSMLQSYKDHVDAFLNLQDTYKSPDRAEELLKIQRAEDEANREFSKHMLERDGVSGYTGEFGAAPNPWDSKWSQFKARAFGESDALRLHERYFRDVAETWRNVMFMEDVYAPLMGLDNNPFGGQRHGNKVLRHEKAWKYMEAYGKNFLGKNLNYIAPIDNSIRDMLQWAGLDPMLAKNTVRSTRNLLAAIKLRINPANWTANYLQKVHTVSLLQFMDISAGGDGKAALEAFNRVLGKNAHDLGITHKEALDWARAQHIVDPLLDMEIRGESKGLLYNTPVLGEAQKAWNWTKDINGKIEKNARESSFLIAFDYYMNKGYSVEQAREAARLTMGMTMVNYDRASRPLMYQNLGMVGEAMAPFAIFRNAFLGNLYLMIKMAGSDPKKLNNFKPLVTQMATFMAMAGAAGMPMVGEYDMIINALNYLFVPEQDLPNSEILGMKWNVPDLLMYGAPSEMLKMLGFGNGVNLTPSMGAVSLDDAATQAIVPFIKAISQLMMLGGKWAASNTGLTTPPSSTDFYNPLRQVTPGIMHPAIEAFFSDWDWSKGLKTTSVEGLTTRTPDDIISLVVSGKHSIKERKERAVERRLDQLEEGKKAQLRNLVKLRTDFVMGIELPSIWTPEDIDNRAFEIYVETGLDPKEFYKRVSKEVLKRQLDKQTRRLLSRSPTVYWKEREREDLLSPQPTYEEE